MRLLVLTPDVKRASYRLRIAAVLSRVPGLEMETVELARSGPELGRELDRAGEFDGVLLHKRLLDLSSAKRLRAAAKQVFYDVDDAVLTTTPAGESWFSRIKRRGRFRATAEIIDVAVAGNEHLAAQLRERGVRTEVIPTCVDPGEYQTRRHHERKPATLVWIGSSSTLPYLEQMLPVLAEARARLDGHLDLVVIADRAPLDAGLPIRFVPWSLAIEKAALLEGDIGIAPTPDDAWTRGKCGFKIIQYMAAGLPVVASPVAANAEIVVDGVTGLLASTPAQWVDAILKLAQDPALREKMGAAGRASVEARYSLASAAARWQEILSQRSAPRF